MLSTFFRRCTSLYWRFELFCTFWQLFNFVFNYLIILWPVISVPPVQNPKCALSHIVKFYKVSYEPSVGSKWTFHEKHSARPEYVSPGLFVLYYRFLQFVFVKKPFIDCLVIIKTLKWSTFNPPNFNPSIIFYITEK